MSRSALSFLAAVLAFATHPVQAQEHYTLGPISRIILVDIKPGKGSEFWTDLARKSAPSTTSTNARGSSRITRWD